jgi:hypothetical protein
MAIRVISACVANEVNPAFVPLIKTIGGALYAGPEVTDPENQASTIPADPQPGENYVEIA